jgi:hypothetical protein
MQAGRLDEALQLPDEADALAIETDGDLRIG